uniref:Ribonuclease A-domain domain-containing protein n=1 Tax=Erpetoichthys calabaricus TaxID=27687 RepID=A0A8C4RRI5_ERPCA
MCSCEKENDYEKFLRQHVDEEHRNRNYDDTYCTQMMESRKMTTGNCKFTNSFIHANKNEVLAVCSKSKTDIRIIKDQFKVTTCKYQKGTGGPPCKYKADNSISCINITCCDNMPVHLYLRSNYDEA